MTRDDVLEMLSILKAAYPTSFQVNGKSMPPKDAEALVKLWTRQFAGEDADAVRAAVDNLISTRTVGYSPTVGEIKDQLHRLRTVNEINDGEAWYMVEKACRRGLYNAREEFDKLPPAVQAAVGGPEQLKAWARMDEETVNSVVASNFRKTFRTVQTREREKALMPPEVRAFVAGIAEKMALGSGTVENKEIPTTQQPAAIPASFKPMAAMPKAPEKMKETEPIKTAYTPLSEEEWTKKRDEMIHKLEGIGGTHAIDTALPRV